MEDFLGSSRVITDSSGNVCYEADFYPFGGERVITNTCPQNYKFMSKERDTETGNDDFGARYYSSSTGRWLSPDWSAIPAPVSYADLTNPQTLNLYAMVRNNPETFADVDGHLAANTFGITDGVDYTGFSNGEGQQWESADEQYVAEEQTQPPQQQDAAAAQNQNQQLSAPAIGAAVGAVGGAVVGAVIGAAAGATVGTVAEPGGGTIVVGILGAGEGAQAGAEAGAGAGAVVGALAPVVYTKTKEAVGKAASQLERALKHLGATKLGGPDQPPRRGWKQSVRDAANQIDKQAARIANKTVSNTWSFIGQLLRGAIE
jgi:RHS repeat-associated protein